MSNIIQQIKLQIIKWILWLPWLPSSELHRLDEWTIEVTDTGRLAIAISRGLRLFFPFSPLIVYKLGNYYQQDRQVEKALACYERAISLNSAYLPALYRAIELAPYRSDLYQNLAKVLADQGKSAEAYIFSQLGQSLEFENPPYATPASAG